MRIFFSTTMKYIHYSIVSMVICLYHCTMNYARHVFHFSSREEIVK